MYKFAHSLKLVKLNRGKSIVKSEALLSPSLKLCENSLNSTLPHFVIHNAFCPELLTQFILANHKAR